jgi:hypothetical protein
MGMAGLIEGAREHHVVDHQRVLTRGEQLRQPHIDRRRIGPGALEHIILGDHAAGREAAPGGCHRFGDAAQLGLVVKQPVACLAVLR